MISDKISALTQQLLRSETPEVAAAVAAHLQAEIREFIAQLCAKAEFLSPPEASLTPEHKVIAVAADSSGRFSSL